MSKSNIISDLCDYFYDFVDPFIKEYLKDISQNRIIVKTKSGSFEEYKNDFDEYDFRKKMMENAFNSQNFKKFYDKITKDYGIKNKEIRLFDTLFIVNITEDLKHALS